MTTSEPCVETVPQQTHISLAGYFGVPSNQSVLPSSRSAVQSAAEAAGSAPRSKSVRIGVYFAPIPPTAEGLSAGVGASLDERDPLAERGVRVDEEERGDSGAEPLDAMVALAH